MSLSITPLQQGVAKLEQNLLHQLEVLEEGVNDTLYASCDIKQRFLVACCELRESIGREKTNVSDWQAKVDLRVKEVNELAKTIFSEESAFMRIKDEFFESSKTVFGCLKERLLEFGSDRRRVGAESVSTAFRRCLERHPLVDPAHKKMGVFADLETKAQSLVREYPGRVERSDVAKGALEVLRYNSKLRDEVNSNGSQYQTVATLTTMTLDCIDKIP